MTALAKNATIRVWTSRRSQNHPDLRKVPQTRWRPMASAIATTIAPSDLPSCAWKLPSCST
eukprot:2469848-Alexandrium_andersonii.AAC.1